MCGVSRAPPSPVYPPFLLVSIYMMALSEEQVSVLVLALYPGFPRCDVTMNMQKEKEINIGKRDVIIKFNARSPACNKTKSV